MGATKDKEEEFPMKKLIAILTTLTLLLCGMTALAEGLSYTFPSGL